MVVVTSRAQLTGLVAAEGAYALTLGLLTEAEARELLALRLGAAQLAAEPEAAAELIGLCARLPGPGHSRGPRAGRPRAWPWRARCGTEGCPA